MDSPLKYDEKTIKEFGIDEATDLSLAQKIGYVRAQAEEIQKMLWRSRTDLLLAENQKYSKNETIAGNAGSKVTEHRFTIGQFVESIKLLNVLKDELEAQLPTQLEG